MGLACSAVLPNPPAKPAINVFINRGSGTFASSITTTMADTMQEQVNKQAGPMLLQKVLDELGPEPQAARRDPVGPVEPGINVVILRATAAAPGAANGLSAFYFTLLLVLAGSPGSWSCR